MSEQQLKIHMIDPAIRRSTSDELGLVEYLAFSADQANYRCADLLRRGRKDEAIAVAGEAAAYEQMIAIVAPPDAPQEERDEVFVDPGYRFRPELAPQEETADVGTD